MWETVAFVGGMLVLLLFFALIPLVYDLPDAIVKYLSRRSQPAAPAVAADSDEAAARLLGESLRRSEASAATTAEVTAAFWAADGQNRRALAHMLAGMTADGPPDDEAMLLTAIRGLPPPGGEKPKAGSGS